MTETLFIEPVNMCNTFHTTKVKHWLKQILLQRVSLVPSPEGIANHWQVYNNANEGKWKELKMSEIAEDAFF